MQVLRYKVAEARCRRVDVEAWRHGALEPWRRAVGMQTWKQEVRSSGAPESHCRYSDVEAWRHGGLEARFRRCDIEV